MALVTFVWNIFTQKDILLSSSCSTRLYQKFCYSGIPSNWYESRFWSASCTKDVRRNFVKVGLKLEF